MTQSKKLVAFKVFILLLIGCVAYVFYTWAMTVPELRRQIQLATVRNPEPLTELYFENHTELPGYVVLDRDYPYAFTIHNLEGRTVHYRYKVYIDTGTKQLPLASGSAMIMDGKSKTIRQTLLQHTSKGRVKVVVALPDLHQQIDFWITTP